MREAFIDTITELAEDNKNIYLLTADMGFGLTAPFAKSHPDRFINVGVAEQNMIGIATGLALSGKTVFCYSIANFPTLRCLEQIRNGICYHKLSVCIVAGGTGLIYGALGSTHHATEDIACMRSLPDMTVIAPCDKAEATMATRGIIKLDGPSYLRLGKASENVTHLSKFRIGEAITVLEGTDVTLISMGQLLQNTLQAAEELSKRGVQARVVDMHTIKPLDKDAVLKSALTTKVIITVEEHSVLGGLGSAVAEVISGVKVPHAPLIRMGVSDSYPTKAFSYDALLALNHLTVADIVKEVIDAI